MADYEKVSTRPCKFCGRKFVPESLSKHQPTCQKLQKKRKPFDSSKQRADGEQITVRQIKAAQKKVVAPPKSNWRQQHNEFIRNIRAAKGAQDAINSGGPLPPPPPPAENPDYITCPYCNRRFNEKAAERHINFCKTQAKKLPGKSREISSEEKQRAKARTTYQAPRPKARGAANEASSPGMGQVGGRGGYSTGGSAGSGYGGSSGGGGYGGRSTGAPPARAPPAGKAATGRTPVNNGYSSAGRAPAGSTRGRSTGATTQDIDNDDLVEYGGMGDFDVGNGRALRTGRDARAYEEARREAKGPSTMARTKAPQMRGGMPGNKPASGGYGMLREAESGYYSSSSENDMSGRGNTPSKFCHECGSKYPTTVAKFCCECGMRRMTVS